MSETQIQIIKRLKSFTWRMVMAAVAFSVAWALDNLQILELSPFATIIVTLVLGEISKYLNRNAV